MAKCKMELRVHPPNLNKSPSPATLDFAGSCTIVLMNPQLAVSCLVATFEKGLINPSKIPNEKGQQTLAAQTK